MTQVAETNATTKDRAGRAEKMDVLRRVTLVLVSQLNERAKQDDLTCYIQS